MIILHTKDYEIHSKDNYHISMVVDKSSKKPVACPNGIIRDGQAYILN